MNFIADLYKNATPRQRLALNIAIAADAMEILLWPFFFEGFLSAANLLTDTVVGVILVRLLGFHWVLLPSFVIENLPIASEVPTWVLSTAYVIRKQQIAASATGNQPATSTP